MFGIHDDYIRVDWPDSQYFDEYTKEDGIVCGDEAGEIFVPLEIYNEVYKN